MSQNNLDRKDLKIQALLEKVATLTQQYENQVADLRVALTISEQNLRDAHEQLACNPEENVPTEVPTDEVPQEPTVEAD
jgi:hypothetical protein